MHTLIAVREQAFQLLVLTGIFTHRRRLTALYSLLDDDGDGSLTVHEVRKTCAFCMHAPSLPPTAGRPL